MRPLLVKLIHAMPKRPRTFKRPPPTRDRRKVYVVATEGKKTEEIYFEIFNGDPFRQNVRVKVLPTGKGDSSPTGVINRLNNYVHQYGLTATDELWLVIDTDSWGEDKLQAIHHECQRKGYSLAVSNPCFELWLVLHQQNPRRPPTLKECERELTRLLGAYQKSSYDTKKLIPNIRRAIEYARSMHEEPSELWPGRTGTHVYILVEKLIE
jgi:hypothetical protein